MSIRGSIAVVDIILSEVLQTYTFFSSIFPQSKSQGHCELDELHVVLRLHSTTGSRTETIKALRDESVHQIRSHAHSPNPCCQIEVVLSGGDITDWRRRARLWSRYFVLRTLHDRNASICTAATKRTQESRDIATRPSENKFTSGHDKCKPRGGDND